VSKQGVAIIYRKSVKLLVRVGWSWGYFDHDPQNYFDFTRDLQCPKCDIAKQRKVD
jgi:hypothetical protein